ncbi:MAG: phosphoglycerate dehydrogenase [Alphaproteobacteria bacterium]|nr:phosphoglycerate dehydrogenase [Alphaproteobacteria bacterium]
MRAIVTTVPFGDADPTPVKLMNDAGLEFVVNPLGRKLRPEEVADMIRGYEIVIAGTEPITADVIAQCPDLKAICRVGIGLDSVDLLEAQRRGIALSFTPDGPSPAVAELTVGLIVDLLRQVTATDRNLRNGSWARYHGRRISESTIGVIGVGRIGGMLINHLVNGFPNVRILANDLPERTGRVAHEAITWVDKETIYRESDVITLHVPLTASTQNLITRSELAMMKPTSHIINTARGGIVNEQDLAAILRDGSIGGAAIDVFEEEPYAGPLCEVMNTVLTCHMGSMTQDCRASMEIEATREAIRFMKGEPFVSPVPESEYELAAQMALL